MAGSLTKLEKRLLWRRIALPVLTLAGETIDGLTLDSQHLIDGSNSWLENAEEKHQRV